MEKDRIALTRIGDGGKWVMQSWDSGLRGKLHLNHSWLRTRTLKSPSLPGESSTSGRGQVLFHYRRAGPRSACPSPGKCGGRGFKMSFDQCFFGLDELEIVIPARCAVRGSYMEKILSIFSEICWRRAKGVIPD